MKIIMINFKYIYLILFFNIIGIIYSHALYAENFPTAVIGILDIQRIKKESSAIISIRNQIQEMRSDYEKKFRSKEDELRDEEQEIARQRTVLSDEAFKLKEREFRIKVQKLQEKMKNASLSLQQSEADAVRIFNNNLRPILVESSKAYGVTVVLFASQVAFAPRSLDITEDVMKRLNTIIPEINVKKPEKAP
ncbi:OmpH family outer membrane protein [Alphaproteobacteria bacterium]|nr:OmpH family outer membrane protein [Alphaproteobacteria bacterium]